MAAPLYALTQELYDDLIDMLKGHKELRADVNALKLPQAPKPRDVWAQITSATTQSVTIAGASRSGYYPGTHHYRDEEGAAFSTGVTCWVKEVNGRSLLPSLYHRGFPTYADDDGTPIIYVDSDFNLDSTGNLIIEGDLTVEGDTLHEGNTTLGGPLYFVEQAAPSTPASGFGVLYVSTGGAIIFINDAGVSFNLTTGGGVGGSGTATYLPVWTAGTTLGDSYLSQAVGLVTLTPPMATVASQKWRTNPADGNAVNGYIFAQLFFDANFNSTQGTVAKIHAVYDGNGTTQTGYISFFGYTAGVATEYLRVTGSAVNLPQTTATRYLKVDGSKNIISSDQGSAERFTGIGINQAPVANRVEMTRSGAAFTDAFMANADTLTARFGAESATIGETHFGSSTAHRVGIQTNGTDRLIVHQDTGNITAKTTTNATGGAPSWFSEDAASNPTGIPANSAGWFAKDVAGTTEFFTIDEGGTATQQTPHAKDAPANMYDFAPGIDLITRTSSPYPIDGALVGRPGETLNGWIRWVSHERMTHTPAAPKWAVESFDEYAARMAYSPPERERRGLIVRDWAQEQEAKRVNREKERAEWVHYRNAHMLEEIEKEFLPDDEKDKRGIPRNYRRQEYSRPRPQPYQKKARPPWER